MLLYSEVCEDLRYYIFFLLCKSSVILLSLVSDVMCTSDVGHCIIFMCFGESVTWQDICFDEVRKLDVCFTPRVSQQ